MNNDATVKDLIGKLSHSETVRKFDFSGLLTLVLPMLVDVLLNCLKQRSQQTIQQMIESNNWWVRSTIDRTIIQAARNSGVRLTADKLEALRQEILTQIQATGAGVLIAEVTAESWEIL